MPGYFTQEELRKLEVVTSYTSILAGINQLYTRKCGSEGLETGVDVLTKRLGKYQASYPVLDLALTTCVKLYFRPTYKVHPILHIIPNIYSLSCS